MYYFIMNCLFFFWFYLFIYYYFCMNEYIYINMIILFMLFMIIQSGLGFNYMWYLSDYIGLYNDSYMLIMLTIWIGYLMIFSINNNKIVFLKIMLLMMSILFFFMSLDFFSFYFFFEFSLIPIYFLVIDYGHGKNRYLAGMYLFFYTLLFSMPLLIMIIYLYYNNMTFSFLLYELMNLNLFNYQFFFIIISFMVKLPLYMFHIWLPKAHVEAPVYGSMILAGLMLKLGGYGLIRLINIFKFNFYNFSLFFIIIGVFGCLMISLVCLRQVDMKMLVAYSSVVHMNLMMCGFMTLMKLGVDGTLMMMVAHGLSSSGMFYMLNILYERTKSRLMLMNVGIIQYLNMHVMWFFLCSSSISAPFSLNLVSEILLFMSLYIWLNDFMLIIMFICFLSVVYMIYLFLMILNMKNNFIFNKMFNSVMMVEYFVGLFHWIPLNLFIFNLDIF